VTIRFRPSIEFRCPFCALRVKAGEAVRPGEAEMAPCVAHDEPACEQFESMEPDEFMRAVRKTAAS